MRVAFFAALLALACSATPPPAEQVFGPPPPSSEGFDDFGQPPPDASTGARPDGQVMADCPPANATEGIALGVTAGNPATDLPPFAALVGRRPAIAMWYAQWARNGFDRGKVEDTWAECVMPLITWEPWDPSKGVNQPNYALRAIAAGSWDTYVRQFARDAKAFGKPFYLRFAHEMNGNWYPWGAGVNGNQPADYVAAWRHVVDLFRAEGVTTVRWVWSPGVLTPGVAAVGAFYPGAGYVDWVALDGYNWGASRSDTHWTSFVDLFASAYWMLTPFGKPILVGETASAEQGGDKAAWIRQGLLGDVPTRMTAIRGVIWFNINKETDWRVNSSAASLAAYREVAASPRYQGGLP